MGGLSSEERGFAEVRKGGFRGVKIQEPEAVAIDIKGQDKNYVKDLLLL